MAGTAQGEGGPLASFGIPSSDSGVSHPTSNRYASLSSPRRDLRCRTERQSTLRLGLVLAVFALASCSASTMGSTSSHLAVAVDIASTPSGWVPVHYGDARISVPAAWVLGPSTQEGGLVEVGNRYLYSDSSITGVQPLALAMANKVDISSSTQSGATGRTASLNGVTVYWTSQDSYVAPSLLIQVSASGPLAGRVLRTLSPSPQAVALASGPSPPIPDSWHRVSFGGVSVAVPQQWLQLDQSQWNDGCDDISEPWSYNNVLILDVGTSYLESCGLPWEPSEAEVHPANGVVIDPGPIGPLHAGNDLQLELCLHLKELTACPTTTSLWGVLVMSVAVQGRSQPVAVEIGLGGDGMIARTILYSMQAA